MSTWLCFKLSKKCKNSVKRSKIHEPEDSRLNLVILYSQEDQGNQLLPDEWEKKQTKFISSNNIKSNKQQAAKTASLVLSKLTLRPSVPSRPLSPLSPWGKKKKHKAWAESEWKCWKKRRAVPAATERRAFLTLKPLCPLSPYREQS